MTCCQLHTLIQEGYPERVISRTEVERRRVYLDKLHLKLASGHDVSMLIQNCLSNSADTRPSASQVVKTFDNLNEHYHFDDYQAHDAFRQYEAPPLKVAENRQKIMVCTILCVIIPQCIPII